MAIAPHGRETKGWRWRLPWSDPRDTKLPLVMLLVAVAFLVYIFLNLDHLEPLWIFVGSLVFGVPAGGMLVMWLRD